MPRKAPRTRNILRASKRNHHKETGANTTASHRLKGDDLLREFANELRHQGRLVRLGLAAKEDLWSIASAMRQLLADGDFVELLRVEKLDKMPADLFSRIEMLPLQK